MIYFVFPIYNEEDNIRSLVSNVRKIMLGREYKMIAVNDGSTDRSLEILNELKQEDLIVTSSTINMNIGAVFSRGIDKVLEMADDNDVMIIMEGDQTSEIGLIDTLSSKIVSNDADIVIASRYVKGGKYVNFPFLRTVFSFCANKLMHFYFPIKNVVDYTIFFRSYRVGIVKKAVKYFGKYGLIQSKGFVANAELLIKLSFFTDKIKEIPFVYNYGKKEGTSKINIIRTVNEYFVLVMYIKRIFNKIKSLNK